ncbi:hypothetical protein C0991_004549 [Blastosporella zonata]|nr:hypothetical protein C0991_004549 [Blastosporella zonata]
MASRSRPNAFEVSFPEESAPHEATSLHPEPSDPSASSISLKRKGESPGDTRVRNLNGVNYPHVTAFYVDRDGELENLVIADEREDEEDDDPDAKPIRVLTDFAIYDPKHNNEMVLLNAIEEDDGVDRQFEAEGAMLPYFPNEEDEGDEEPRMVRLGAVLRYTFDYTRAEGLFIETEFAWYILDAPTPEYEPLFQHFFAPLRISQVVISTAFKTPHITYDSFIQRFINKVDPFGATYQEKHLVEVKSYIRNAVDECEESEKLKEAPLIKHIIRDVYLPQPHHRHANAPRTRGKPPPIKALTKNLDIALLDRENAIPTHVTPLIASLAQGLVTEELVVLGVRPQIESKAQKAQKEQEKAAAQHRLRELLAKAKGERKKVERMGQNSRYPLAVKINGEIFQSGDFVLIPRARDKDNKGHYKASDTLPDIEDVHPTETIADYFCSFAQIVYGKMDPAPGTFHVHWLTHSSKTMMEELGRPQELFWNDVCDDDRKETEITWGAVVAKIKVQEGSNIPENPGEYFVKQNQQEWDANEKQLKNEKGIMNGIALFGQNYHYQDFVLYRAPQGPAHIGYIKHFRHILNKSISSDVILQRVGRISSIGAALPDDVLRDERHIYLTKEEVTVPLKELICLCHVLTPESFGSTNHLRSWLALSPYHFFIKFSFPSMQVHSWAERKHVPRQQHFICRPCTVGALKDLKDIHDFLEDAERHPLRTLDVFGGVGAFSMGLGEGSGCLQVTDLIELAPSAAKTVMRNFPGVAVHNRCANEVLRYSIKEKQGQKPEPLRQHYDPSLTLPSLGKPDVIIAGAPCQTHSRLNRFKRAGDKKSNLILTALSFVDHLRPKLFYFENVPGFKEFTFDAVQAAPHTVEGGIPMGGLKFVVRALIDMNYQVRFGFLQAGHYGTPQRRLRFFLVAAVDGHPLPELPQPSHDFPDNQGLKLKLESSQALICPIRISNGTAPHPFVTVDDAISDLPRFHWKPPKSLFSPGDGIRLEICDLNLAQCGISGPARYHHEVKTSYQGAARSKATKNLQQFTRTFKPVKVKRVLAIPMRARADYRDLPADQLEWQVSNPLSAAARNNYRAGMYGRLDKAWVFPTTVTNMDTTAKQSRVLNPYILSNPRKCHRMVTVRELARSQGFPDHFVFEASDNGVVTMHRQIGNAVPLQVGIALGRELRIARFKQWLGNRQNAITMD